MLSQVAATYALNKLKQGYLLAGRLPFKKLK